MNQAIAQILIGVLMSTSNMSPDKIHILLMITEPLIHKEELTEEQIEVYMEQIENVKEL